MALRAREKRVIARVREYGLVSFIDPEQGKELGLVEQFEQLSPQDREDLCCGLESVVGLAESLRCLN